MKGDVRLRFLKWFDFGSGDGDGGCLNKDRRTMVDVFSPQVKQEKKAYIKI
jgi:hypothetical protein